MPSSFFALFDDIATLLDDISAMTKVAAGKTAGVVGDDLALNAQQVSGSAAHRELPVVWAVAKGSMVNKAILVPAAMALSLFETWIHGHGIMIPLIAWLLMIGGSYLCYEGVEKIAHAIHKRLHGDAKSELEQAHDAANPDIDAFEREKIKGAVRTDFVLSAEIIVIALGTVDFEPFLTQLGVLVVIALAMTVGVYGLVAAIVKLDDLGLHLTREGAMRVSRWVGRVILAIAPRLMHFLSVGGTIAMFLVGGGILVHGIAPLHHFIEGHADNMLGWLWVALFNIGIGAAAGVLLLAVASVLTAVRRRLRGPAAA